MNNLKRAQFKAKQYYGVEINDEDFEEIALDAWETIGNKRTRLYRVKANLADGLEVELPCNCELVEAVTYDLEDPQLSSNIHVPGDLYKTIVELHNELFKPFNDNYYQRGRFVKYTQAGNTLFFEHNFGPINILYHGIIMGDDDLPEITEKEANAIACFVAYTQLYKKGLATMNTGLIQLAKDLENKWYRLCDAARTPDYISQNDMNKILDAKTSWDRKVYNKSYKPIK